MNVEVRTVPPNKHHGIDDNDDHKCKFDRKNYKIKKTTIPLKAMVKFLQQLFDLVKHSCFSKSFLVSNFSFHLNAFQLFLFTAMLTTEAKKHFFLYCIYKVNHKKASKKSVTFQNFIFMH